MVDYKARYKKVTESYIELAVSLTLKKAKNTTTLQRHSPPPHPPPIPLHNKDIERGWGHRRPEPVANYEVISGQGRFFNFFGKEIRRVTD